MTEILDKNAGQYLNGEVQRFDADNDRATVEDLIAPRSIATTHVAVALESGKSVIIRKLSRAEALSFKGKTGNLIAFERKLLAMAMVEPAMTENQVAQWQRVDEPHGDIQIVFDKIVEISGMKQSKEVAKSTVSRVSRPRKRRTK